MMSATLVTVMIRPVSAPASAEPSIENGRHEDRLPEGDGLAHRADLESPIPSTMYSGREDVDERHQRADREVDPARDDHDRLRHRREARGAARRSRATGRRTCPTAAARCASRGSTRRAAGRRRASSRACSGSGASRTRDATAGVGAGAVVTRRPPRRGRASRAAARPRRPQRREARPSRARRTRSARGRRRAGTRRARA